MYLFSINSQNKFLWQITIDEFLSLLQSEPNNESKALPTVIAEDTKKYVYGIPGIAKLFDCSIPTANRIKKSGIIDDAITQVGRKIVVEADLAIRLAQEKRGGR